MCNLYIPVLSYSIRLKSWPQTGHFSNSIDPYVTSVQISPFVGLEVWDD